MNTRAKHERLTLTVEEAAEVLGIGRTLAYESVQRGDLPTVRIGRRLLVPRAAIATLLSGTAAPGISEPDDPVVERPAFPPRSERSPDTAASAVRREVA